jgi:hypothetical protein
LALFTKYKAFFSTFRTPHRTPASLQAISSSSHLPPVPLPARLPRSARTGSVGDQSANHRESPRAKAFSTKRRYQRCKGNVFRRAAMMQRC